MSREQFETQLAALIKRACGRDLLPDEIAEALENAIRELETQG